MSHTSSPLKFPFVFGILLSLLGCNSVLISCDATQPVTPSDNPFESVDPGNPSGNQQNEPPTAGVGGSTAGDGDANGDPDRVIEEADIVKIEGDTLYALSQYGGLSTIDISQPNRLRLLGRHKTVATPFEMYVRDGIVLSLYQSYGEYVYDEDDGQARWVQTSELVVVDARTPENLTPLARFDIPGLISDSRVVGDVLYVASFEDGYCWGCRESAPRTAVISLDISDLTQVARVAELSFDERNDVWSWHRSISVTDERMYVSGPTWSDTGPVGSTIQVIDISDPNGALHEGASVQVAGQINNRWQMDEYEGVLRVISQPFAWDLNTPPTLQTFTVESSDSLVALGQTSLTLPRPEQLQSTRFDGDRAYAITAERTDPLITLDLTDPAHPTQAGLLEMPGWIYHMEPRGNRVLGLGFDQTAGTGALTVSLFDVSDLQQPTMLDRVNFGGEWAWLAEDQDRIHKAFNIIDEAGLLLVPFSGYVDDSTDPYQCGGRWQSGVQLIDWAEDALQLRGVAPAKSQARRGFLHNETLFTMSDERVETFDIANRDEPVARNSVSLAQNISFVAGIADDRIVRVGQNWWTGTTQLDLTTVDHAATPVASGTLEVDGNTSNSCYSGEYLESILVDDSRANLVYASYDWDPATGKEQPSMRIATIDLSSETPELMARSEIELASGYYYYPYGLVDRGGREVSIGTTLAIAETQTDYATSNPVITRSVVHVLDLSDPQDMKDKVIEVPSELGATGLVASGTVVARSHYEASPSNPGSVRFYLDRIDVSNPRRPVLLPVLNIPGSLLAFDAEQQRALTVDYGANVVDGITAAECYSNPNARFETNGSGYEWNVTPGRCTILRYALNLIDLAADTVEVLGRYAIGDGEQIGQLTLGEDRAFLTLNTGYGWGYALPAVDAPGASDVAFCYGGCAFDPEDHQLPVLSVAGLQSGNFAVGRLEVAGGDWWSYSPIAAVGTRAVLASGWRGKVHIIEADDAEDPNVVAEVDVAGYVQSLTVVGNTALASLGLDGVELIELFPEQ